jgi:hypothetical protein
MAFPFVAPLEDWVKECLHFREVTPEISAYKNAFVIMTSGANVVKDTAIQAFTDKEKRLETLKKIIDDKSFLYEGCVIANNINSQYLTYSYGSDQYTDSSKKTGATPVGIDLNGKLIVADEYNRGVSTPFIEALSIDSDGANNTLKTAKVTVKCFSLKQLEMFELFFMKPGMNVIIEFGDTSLLTGIYEGKIKQPDPNKLKVWRDGKSNPIKYYTNVSEALIDKNGGASIFEKQYTKAFRSGLDASRDYFTKIEQSLGTYDFIAGKVSDFTFSYDTSGNIYTCEITVLQSNQLSIALPNNPPKAKPQKGQKPSTDNQKIDSISEIVENIAFNFLLDKDKLDQLLRETPHPEQQNAVGDKGRASWILFDTFNFEKKETKEKDVKTSGTIYISFRFILYILMNYILTDKDELTKNEFGIRGSKFIVNDNDKEEKHIIPVFSKKQIISSNPAIIFPTSELPKFIAAVRDNADKKKEGIVTIDEKNPLDGTINGYDFHVAGVTKLKPVGTAEGNEWNIQTDGDVRLGNALNIFLRYDDIVRHWNQEVFRADFLDKVLSMINTNSYGLFQLVFAAEKDEPNSPNVILDLKLRESTKAMPNLKQENENENFKFKIGPRGSILKDFSFNFQMSDLMAAQQVFSGPSLLVQVQNEYKEAAKLGAPQAAEYLSNLAPPDKLYKAVDNSMYANADGYWSVNWLEFKLGLAKLEDTKKRLKESSSVLKSEISDNKENKENNNAQENKAGEETAAKDEDLKKEVENLIAEKQEKFITLVVNNAKINTAVTPLIYKDPNFILTSILLREEVDGSRALLTPIEVSFTIDGFSGFRAGSTFNVDGIPEIYNQSGRFQIRNVQHSINGIEWNTSVSADYLPNAKEKKIVDQNITK